MKKILAILFAVLMAIVPAALAIDTGIGVGVDITTEDFEPLIWLCDDRTVRDDNVEWGRTSEGGDKLVERINNYAFEGEQIEWTVLVMDKNGIEKIEDVFGTVGSTQGAGNDIEVNCDAIQGVPRDHRYYTEHGYDQIPDDCNARILEEKIRYFDADTMRFYKCIFTVETPESMYGEYWITIEVVDLDGLSNTMDENEFWFLNPAVALAIDGSLAFEDVRPGTDTYSETILVGNDADAGSGVMLDMFIAGTDFYDSSSSGAKCPVSNQLELDNFRYYAVNGAYSTAGDDQNDNDDYDPATQRDRDDEGYLNIQYGNAFARAVYDEAEILQDQAVGPYYTANLLAPGAELALTFKLSLPEPCNGDFDSGSIYFFGEAV